MIIDKVDIVRQNRKRSPEEKSVNPPSNCISILLYILLIILWKGYSYYSSSPNSLLLFHDGLGGSYCGYYVDLTSSFVLILGYSEKKYFGVRAELLTIYVITLVSMFVPININMIYPILYIKYHPF